MTPDTYERSLRMLQEENRHLRLGIIALTQDLIALRRDLDRILATMRTTT